MTVDFSQILQFFFFHLQIRAEVEADKDQEKKRAVNVATRSLERDLERLKADHATEIEQLNDRHTREISELKKKQWVSLHFSYFYKLSFGNNIFFFHFSVLIVNLKPFIGVVGTLPIVQQNVNKNIGIKNINEFVEENDDFISP